MYLFTKVETLSICRLVQEPAAQETPRTFGAPKIWQGQVRQLTSLITRSAALRSGMKALQRRVVGPSGLQRSEGSIQNIEEWKKDGEPMFCWTADLESFNPQPHYHVVFLLPRVDCSKIPCEKSKHELVRKSTIKEHLYVKTAILSVYTTSTLKRLPKNVASFFHLILLPVCFHHLGKLPYLLSLHLRPTWKNRWPFCWAELQNRRGNPAVLEGSPMKMCHHQLVEFCPTVWKGVLKWCI